MANDWYQKHLKEVSTALTRARSAKPDEGISCALLKTSDGSFVLCAATTAGKSEAMVKEGKTRGCKVVSAGSLYKSESGLTFGVTEGSAAVKKQFTEAATEATGKPVHVLIVALTASDDTAGTTPDQAAAFKERASKLVAEVKKADKEVQARVQQPLVQALTLGKEGRYADAEPFLKQVEQGLAVPVPPPPPLASDAEKAEFTERLRAIKPRYVELLQTNPPNKAVLEKAMTLAAKSAKEAEYVKGLTILDGLDKALNRQPPEIPVPPPPPNEDLAARFTGRLQVIKPRYETAVASNPPNRAVLEQAMTMAQQSAQEAKFARGLKILDGLETALAKSTPDQSGRPKDEEPPSSGLAIWREAREEVGAQLTKLQGNLRQTGDPQLVRIADYGLNGITKRLQVGLQTALIEVDQAAGPARARAAAKAKTMVDEYVNFLKTDPAVELLDTNPFGVTVSLRDTLGKALDTLAKALKT